LGFFIGQPDGLPSFTRKLRSRVRDEVRPGVPRRQIRKEEQQTVLGDVGKMFGDDGIASRNSIVHESR
jgi:hypothetical protein